MRDRADTALDPTALRRLVGEPSVGAIRKQLVRLDAHARRFIALSPMVIVATADADGTVDASPRGDPPGFVRVIDERTLVLPDRRGNRRVDSFTNVTTHEGSRGGVGLLFLVPNVNETLRVNGRGRVVSDPALLSASAVGGVVPSVGLVVEVTEVFFHCARAFLRASLWDTSTWPSRDALPSLGTILRDQTQRTDTTAEAIDERLEAANRELY